MAQSCFVSTQAFVFCICVLLAAGTSARDLDQDLDDTWETVGGDLVRKLVTDLENDPLAAGPKLIQFLRSNDYRVVRFKLSNQARGKQLQFAQTDGILQILKLLKQKESEKRVIAAEVIHLLSTENFALAHQIGLHAWLPDSAGIKELLQMVDSGLQLKADDDTVLAGEEAAHAVWALMMHNADNLEMTHDRKGGEVMKDAIVNSKSYRLKMWAAASLKRLLSDFYNTQDGAYSSKGRKTMANDELRTAFGQDTLFVKKLVHMIKKGKVTEGLERANWPTYATIHDATNPAIQAWAAAGALGTLGMSETNHAIIKKVGGLSALCELKASPCPLERVEAEAALGVLDHDCNPDDADADDAASQEEEEDWERTEL